jgi:DNA invertase Pin-like site-specific DNA recombinase
MSNPISFVKKDKLNFDITAPLLKFMGDRVKAGVANKRAKLAAFGDLSWGRKPLGPQIQLKIQQLKVNKQSIRVIAKTLDISKTTVLKYLGVDKIG